MKGEVSAARLLPDLFKSQADRFLQENVGIADAGLSRVVKPKLGLTVAFWRQKQETAAPREEEGHRRS